MSVDNLRKALGSLDIAKKAELAIETKRILVNKKVISDDVRPSEVERYLNNFIEGKNTRMKYFEAFIEALDKVCVGSANYAFQYGSVKKLKTWRELLIRITNDIPSEQLQKYYENDVMIKDFKTLFIALVEGSINEDEDSTRQQLQLLIQMFKKNKN